jgi:hypothetical protein
LAAKKRNKKQDYTMVTMFVEARAVVAVPLESIATMKEMAATIKESIADAIGQFTPEGQVVVQLKTEVIHGG